MKSEHDEAKVDMMKVRSCCERIFNCTNNLHEAKKQGGGQEQGEQRYGYRDEDLSLLNKKQEYGFKANKTS